MSADYFSTSYTDARSRFLDAAAAVEATTESYPVDEPSAISPDTMSLDVAVWGRAGDPTIVVSSGVHGVEGFFGSAVQCALLRRLQKAQAPNNVRYVLIHAVNPYGFAHLRRCNEDNVDLNRNFLVNTSDYSGAPAGYTELDSLLNPESPPSAWEPFRWKALWRVWRLGLPTLKAAVAGGQYEYPRGLFFGGHGPCWSTRILQENCPHWLANSAKILHVDLHSGLGKFGSYKLLLTESSDSENYHWFLDSFGSEVVEPLAQPDGTAYAASGMLGEWMQAYFGADKYRFVCAEFGTYGIIRVLSALRAENRAHHYGCESNAHYHATKEELLECFCPHSPTWRRTVVESGLRIIDQGAKSLQTD